MMKLGFVSAILPELPLAEVLRFAAEQRYQCVELMCWPVGKADRRFAGITHVNVEKFDKAAASEVAGQIAASGVEASALGYYPNPLDPDPALSSVAVQHLKKVIRAAPMLGLKRINTFVGRDWTRTIDENWPRFLKTWRPLIALAEDHGVRVGIENCPMIFSRDEWPGGKNLATTPAIWRRMFSDIPSDHFGLNYDPSHFILQQMDPAGPLKEFASKLFHIHAKDLLIDDAALQEVGIFALPKEWHRPRIPGYGEIDWAHFMAALMEAGYDGPVCVEVEDDSFGKTLAGRQAALKVARNILAPFFP